MNKGYFLKRQREVLKGQRVPLKVHELLYKRENFVSKYVKKSILGIKKGISRCEMPFYVRWGE